MTEEEKKDYDSTLTMDGHSFPVLKTVWLRARTSDFTASDEIQFYLGLEEPDGSQWFADCIILKRHPRGHAIKSFLSLPAHALQHLVNDLWDVRVRPHDALASTGQLETLNNHLADLRELVFKFDVHPKQAIKQEKPDVAP